MLGLTLKGENLSDAGNRNLFGAGNVRRTSSEIYVPNIVCD